MSLRRVPECTSALAGSVPSDRRAAYSRNAAFASAALVPAVTGDRAVPRPAPGLAGGAELERRARDPRRCLRLRPTDAGGGPARPARLRWEWRRRIDRRLPTTDLRLGCLSQTEIGIDRRRVLRRNPWSGSSDSLSPVYGSCSGGPAPQCPASAAGPPGPPEARPVVSSRPIADRPSLYGEILGFRNKPLRRLAY